MYGIGIRPGEDKWSWVEGDKEEFRRVSNGDGTIRFERVSWTAGDQDAITSHDGDAWKHRCEHCDLGYRRGLLAMLNEVFEIEDRGAKEARGDLIHTTKDIAEWALWGFGSAGFHDVEVDANGRLADRDFAVAWVEYFELIRPLCRLPLDGWMSLSELHRAVLCQDGEALYKAWLRLEANA